jgi:hypothetical protein
MTIILIVLEAVALAAFFAPSPILFAVAAVAAALILLLLVRGLARILACGAGTQAKNVAPKVVLAFSPLCLLFLRFLPEFVFLRDIRGFLLPLASAGVILLLFLLSSDGRAPSSAARPAPKKAWLVLFLVSFAVYAFLASGLVFPQHPLTGDEPHYLLITQSLVADGDINLFNNYAARDYLRFYPGEMESHARPGRRGPGTLYSRHFPGLSLLLVPFYVLAEQTANLKAFIFIVRLPICLLAALLGAAFFLFVLDLTGSRRASLASWLIFSFTGPLLFFSGLIYPEVLAALVSLLVFRYLILYRDERPSVLLLSGLGLALLPWFAVKYLVLSLVLFALAVARRLRRPLAHRGGLIRLSVFPIISAVMYLFFVWSLFGHLAPSAVYSGTEAPKSLASIRPGLATNLGEFWSAGLGLFFEQKAGILVYAPIYLLAAAGFVLLWKKRKAIAAQMLAVFGAFWVLSAASFYLGGYAPPGRPLIPLSWILAGFVGVALAAPVGRAASLVKGSLLCLSFLVAGFSLSAPALLYHLNVNPVLGGAGGESRFLTAASGLFFEPIRWTASFDASGLLGFRPLAAWILVLLLVSALYLRSSGRRTVKAGRFSPTARAMIVIVASLVILAGVFFRVRLDRRAVYPMEGCEVFFQDENHFDPERGGFWTKGTRETFLVLKSPLRLGALSLTLSSAAAGEAEVRVGRMRRVVRHDPKKAPRLELVFESPRGCPWRGAFLYAIAVSERRAFVPYRLDRRQPDSRTLGVFIEIGGLRPAP